MDKKTIRLPRLILGAVVLLVAGILYAWSVIKEPFSVSGFGWGDTQLGFNYTLTIAMFCIGGFVSGLFENKISSKIRMLIAGILIFIGFFVTSKLNQDSIALLYLGYGVCSGFGIGIVYNIVIARTNAWFPDKKGISSGVLMMSFGFGALLLGKLSIKLFEMESFGCRQTSLIYAIAIGAIIALSGLLIRGPKDEEIQKFIKVDSKASDVVSKDFTTLEMVKRKSFWMLFILLVLSTAVGTVALSWGKDVLLSIDVAKDVAITVAGLLAIFNGVGRLIAGWIFDFFGLKAAKITMSLTCLSASVIVLISLMIPNTILGIIGIGLCAFSYGFAPTVAAAVSSQFYGKKNFALNFATVNLILIPSSFYSTIAGKVYESTQSFEIVFILLIACCVVGLIDGLLIKKP